MSKVIITLEFDLQYACRHFSENVIMSSIVECIEDKIVGVAKPDSTKVTNIVKYDMTEVTS